jgi:hypothetical protein
MKYATLASATLVTATLFAVHARATTEQTHPVAPATMKISSPSRADMAMTVLPLPPRADARVAMTVLPLPPHADARVAMTVLPLPPVA